MKILVQSIFQSSEYTISKLFIDSVYFCDVLEDPVRTGPKIWGNTAIPGGNYKMILSFSQRFQKILPLLLDVPGFTGIRIHSGNTSADTHGCLLLGVNHFKGKVIDSQHTMSRFIPILTSSKLSVFEIEIKRL